MRAAAIFSVVLHITVFAVAIVGLPVFERSVSPPPPIVPVDLVTIADKTNVPRKPAKAPEPAPKPMAKPVPPTPPPPKASAPKPAPKPAPEKVTLVVPDEKPKPKPREAQARQREAPKPAPDVSPPRRKPERKPDPAFDPTRIAALLDKSRRERSDAPAADRTQGAESDETDLSRSVSPPSLENRLTLSEIDAVRLQIQRCWSVPAGVRNAEDLVVRLRIELAPDGSLSAPPVVLDRARMNRPGQEHFRVAAESAVRAVLKCQPLKMPVDKYERWRQIELNFDPEDMLGG